MSAIICFQNLSEDFTASQIPAPNRRELNILNEKLNTLIERSAYQQSDDKSEVKHYHYFWFFPDVKLGWE